MGNEMIGDGEINDRLSGDGWARDWAKLAQGLHARFRTRGLAESAQLVSALATSGDGVDRHLRATLGDGFVDLRLITQDAVYRDGDGVEHVVWWVTDKDLALAERISSIARGLSFESDPAAVTTVELALDTADAARISPMWAALLTGGSEAVGLGSLGQDLRDATERVPNLWFQDTEAHDTPRQRFHLDVWVAPASADERIAAAVAAGGTIVDDSEAPAFTVLADADGNRACVCTSTR
jgi:4a-hydroxytetrahydrobiopterin dehydratase